MFFIISFSIIQTMITTVSFGADNGIDKNYIIENLNNKKMIDENKVGINYTGVKIEVDLNKNKIFHNGKEKNYIGKKPIFENNTWYFPVRYLSLFFNIGDYIIEWDDNKKTAEIIYVLSSESTYSFTINKKTAIAWGEEIPIKKEIKLIDNTIYVPLEALKTIFYVKDEDIVYDKEKNILTITRDFDFTTDKISIIENKWKKTNNGNHSYMRKIDIMDTDIIQKIQNGLKTGMTLSENAYASSNTIWLDFHNGTVLGFLTQPNEKYDLNYCSLENGISLNGKEHFNLMPEISKLIANIFMQYQVKGY